MEIKHYVLLLGHEYRNFPSSLLVDEISLVEVASRDIRDLKLEIPEDVYAIQFFDENEIPFQIKSERGWETILVSGGRYNVSSRYYIGGEIVNISEIKDDSTLSYYMNQNEWEYMIKCRTGNFEPFGAEDFIIKQDSSSSNRWEIIKESGTV